MNTSTATMTIEQARQIIWPFNTMPDVKGRPLGELLDNEQLVARHLAWAARNSRKPGVRAACVVLLAALESGETVPAVERQAPPEPDERPDPIVGRTVRWQDLLPAGPQPLTRAGDAPAAVPLPDVCPICGSAVRPYHAWDTRRRLGWRCENGRSHFLAACAEAAKAWFFREYIIPPSDDGTYPGVRRGEMASAATHPCGYLPKSNR